MQIKETVTNEITYEACDWCGIKGDTDLMHGDLDTLSETQHIHRNTCKNEAAIFALKARKLNMNKSLKKSIGMV